MPDADDFDVEYFRSLLKPDRQPAGDAPTAVPARPAAKPAARGGKKQAAKPAAAKRSAAAARKKGAKP